MRKMKGVGRVLGRSGESFVLQGVQRLREEPMREDSNTDNHLFFIFDFIEVLLAALNYTCEKNKSLARG